MLLDGLLDETHVDTDALARRLKLLSAHIYSPHELGHLLEVDSCHGGRACAILVIHYGPIVLVLLNNQSELAYQLLVVKIILIVCEQL